MALKVRHPKVLPVAYLLGAGASADAGIPTAKGFVHSIKESLDNMIKDREEGRVSKSGRWPIDDLHRAKTELNAIEEDVKKNGRDFDVEVLLEELERRSPGTGSGPSTAESKAIETLKARLDEHMRAQFIEATPEKVSYLSPVLDLPQRIKELTAEENILKIFTLNYDLTIECLCYHNDVSCDDGFGPVWLDDGHLNTSHRLMVHLNKIHGSISWHSPIDRNNGNCQRYFRVPLRSGAHRKKLFVNAQFQPFLIFRNEHKQHLRGPAREAFEKFKHTLRSGEIRALVIIGCSLRDETIAGVICDGMRENRSLRVAIVDKDPERVLSNLEKRNLKFERARSEDFPLKDEKEPLAGFLKNPEDLWNWLGDAL